MTYTYTARSDLSFKGVCFNVKGSGHDQGNNGMTIARKPELINGDSYRENDHEVFAVCPMDCTKCDLWKDKNDVNIVFPLL